MVYKRRVQPVIQSPTHLSTHPVTLVFHTLTHPSLHPATHSFAHQPPSHPFTLIQSFRHPGRSSVNLPTKKKKKNIRTSSNGLLRYGSLR